MLAMFFDGKVSKWKSRKAYRRELQEKHISIIEDPASIYLIHVSPEEAYVDRAVAFSVILLLAKNILEVLIILRFCIISGG